MDTLSLALTFIFGAIVGSFLNVVSLRFNTGKNIGGRSGCMTCGNTLGWKELVPIASFLAQKGKCRNCKSRISWQYPLVEFAAGAVFTLIFFVFPPTSPFVAITTAIHIIVACLLLIITVYDAKHKIIPDQWVYTFDLLALASLFVGGSSLWHIPAWSALVAGPLIALPFALIWLVSKGTWMGLGDAKLSLGIGWFLGIAGGVNALVLAFWIAAAVSVAWMGLTYRRFKPRTEVPFGPFLIIGFYIVLFSGLQVMDISLLKQMIGL